jgi:UDP-N-acetylmuramoyl-L-alanyl-D-glutamate--2,6-diaminopimelate ligase
VDAGCEAAVLEVSSHALALERVRGVHFDVGVFTNLTPEHLDFHNTMEEYFETKASLFDHSNHFIANADNEWVARINSDEFFSIKAKARVNWQAKNIVQKPSGLEFSVVAFGEHFPAQLPMIGDFNVQNTLAALASSHKILHTPGQDERDSIETLEFLIKHLSSFAGVPGRMQMVQHNKQSPRVVVDFAHTAPALEKALLALRPTTTGKLIVVIGAAGGNRDPQKRAPLGQIATQYADHAIFTEEDCRDTPIMDILYEMERGAKQNAHPSYELIPDRREAIWAALERATPQDTVLLAGKGPEETLERAGEVLPWNEVEVALELLGKITHTLEG